MRNAFVKTLFELAGDSSNVFLMTADLGFNVLNQFEEAYPDRFINAGVCEQNMTSVAAGIALEGNTVFTYSIANFPTLRCLEQIRNDVAYHRANVKIVAVGAGFAYGALGMSHHATEDIAILRALPEMVIFTPSDPLETAAVTRIAAQMDGPCYIRLGKGGEKNLHAGIPDVQMGRALCLKAGGDTAILVAGAIANEALLAAELLADKGISCAVYSFPTVKPIDKALIIELSQRYDFLFSLEEHTIVGGFGGAVAEVLAETNSCVRLERMGLPDVFASSVGSQSFLRTHYQIDGMSIAELILSQITA